MHLVAFPHAHLCIFIAGSDEEDVIVPMTENSRAIGCGVYTCWKYVASRNVDWAQSFLIIKMYEKVMVSFMYLVLFST